MKRIILFLVIAIVVVYGAIALLLFGFGRKSAPADATMIVHYMQVNEEGVDQIVKTQTVPLYNNKETGVAETKKNHTRMEKDSVVSNPGNKFLGWQIEDYGDLIASRGYFPAGLSGDYLKVRADWEGNIYWLSFDARGGVNPQRMQVRYGDFYGDVISGNNPTKAGYAFDGWYTARTGGARVLPSDKVSIVSNTTLYAHWQESSEVSTNQPFNISFDLNYAAAGGSASMVSGSTLVNVNPLIQTMGEPLPAAVAGDSARYTFLGWFKSGTNTQVTSYADARSQLSTGTTTIYLVAKWSDGGSSTPTPVTYTVTLNADGGSNSGCLSVSAATTYLPISAKSEYAFGGWYTGIQGTGVQYTDASGYLVNSITSDITLYAKWIENVYTVTLNADGGSNSGSYSVSATTTYLPISAKSGYTFEGWYTGIQGTGVQYANASGTLVKTLTGNVTLYAKWHYQSTVNPIDNSFVVDVSLSGLSNVYPFGKTLKVSEIIDPLSPLNIKLALPADSQGFKCVGWYYKDRFVVDMYDVWTLGAPVNQYDVLIAIWE